MKKKYLAVVIGMIGIIGCCCGCEEESGKEIKKNGMESVVKNDIDQKPEGIELVVDRTQFKVPKESQEYNFETDYQYYMTQTFGSVETENGYYYSDGAYCYNFDKQSHTYHILCNKPQCLHEDNTCNGYAPNLFEMEYYEGNIYMVCDSVLVEAEDENVVKYSIVKMSEDGTTKDKVRDIAIVAKTDLNITANGYTSYMRYIQHRGYLYYVYQIGCGTGENDSYINGSNCLYRVALDGSGEEECLMPLDVGTDVSYIHMSASGSYVYFVMADGQGFGKLYRYNTEYDVMEEVGIGSIAAECYNALGEKVLYKKNYFDNMLYLYNPMDGTEKVFADMTEYVTGESWNFYHDSNYMYLYVTDEEKKTASFLVINKLGEYVNEVVVSNSYNGGYPGDFLGGDVDYMMYKPFPYEEKKKFLYLDKSKIADGNPEWREAKRK